MTETITLRQCVEFAFNTETEVSEYYKHLAEQCSEDNGLSLIFRTLSMDEEAHKIQFKLLLDKVSESEIDLSEEQNDFIMAMSLSKSFAQIHGRHEYVYNKDNREQLLFDLFEFEKATLGFHLALSEIMGDEPVMKEIVKIEKNHVVAVMKMVITGTDFVSMQNNWP